jgi:hypothetical protein
MFPDCSHIAIVTPDLFDVPPVPGLHTQTDFLSPAEEGSLIAAIDAVELAPFRFQQWTGKRLTHSFGWQYDFQSGELGRGDAMPDWLLPIRDRAAVAAGMAPDALVQALLLRYDPGAGSTCRSSHAGSTICRERFGTIGSTASRRSIRPAGRSLSDRSRLRA